jgi:hypothetical protein
MTMTDIELGRTSVRQNFQLELRCVEIRQKSEGLPDGTSCGGDRGRHTTMLTSQPICSHFAVQAQFAPSFKSPVPLYSAYCGYGHNGRVRSCAPFPII